MNYLILFTGFALGVAVGERLKNWYKWASFTIRFKFRKPLTAEQIKERSRKWDEGFSRMIKAELERKNNEPI